jgi:hypothetical protein
MYRASRLKRQIFCYWAECPVRISAKHQPHSETAPKILITFRQFIETVSTWPITLAALSKAWTLFERWDCSWNPNQGMDISVRLFCACLILCVGSGLATDWSPSKESYRLLIGLRNWRSDQGPIKGCRTVDIPEWNSVFRKLTARALGDQNANVDFVESSFIGLRDFIFLRYYATTDILPSSFRFRFWDKQSVSIVHESAFVTSSYRFLMKYSCFFINLLYTGVIICFFFLPALFLIPWF